VALTPALDDCARRIGVAHAQRSDADRSACGLMLVADEIFCADFAVGGQRVGHVHQEAVELDHVVERCANGIERGFQILKDPRCLSTHVALADNVAVLVECHLARNQDQAAASDFGDMRVGRTVYEAGGIDEAHGIRICRGRRLDLGLRIERTCKSQKQYGSSNVATDHDGLHSVKSQ